VKASEILYRADCQAYKKDAKRNPGKGAGNKLIHGFLLFTIKNEAVD
jgi:hypothetical protein